MANRSKIILGIDPGTVVMGYSLLRITGNELSVIRMDAVRLNTRKDMFERLSMIHDIMNELILGYSPQELAIEAPFFGKNVQSMLKLGRAQGIAIAVAMQHGMPVTEYAPKKVKQAITGNGNAPKEQVWEMLQRWISLKDSIRTLDASDALAVALCHHFHQQSPAPVVVHGNRKKGWADFIRQNPDRLAGQAISFSGNKPGK